MKKFILIVMIVICSCFFHPATAQKSSLDGRVTNENVPQEFVNVYLEKTKYGTQTDSLGFYRFRNLPPGRYKMVVSCLGYSKFVKEINIKSGNSMHQDVDLSGLKSSNALEDVVVTGTMKAVNRLESPVPVEVYTPAYFKKNPTPSIFDALQNVNGVRPQLNCNVCNTGDIHINGLEGPYTMVLIDGMPIVSSLGAVYGLSGIPSSLVERIEVVKGPASSLYGSEAVGGLINIITKKKRNASLLSVDVFATDWKEYNVDLSLKLHVGKKASVLTGINYFNFRNKVDKNHDNFTDVTLQDRISVFQKWSFYRPQNRIFSLAGRFIYEDRWGGDTRWSKKYRGGDEIYGESIYTNRLELLGNYQFPFNEKMLLSFSLISHDQNSRYGTTSYIAEQKIAFGQLTWDKTIGRHDLLAGAALRYTYYDDNTPATADADSRNKPEKTRLPGLFIQDEISLTLKHKLLLGFRYDHNNIHGDIFTPRIAWKWSLNEKNIIRLNAGTGFRVVNLFTEDHAALTGGRDVVILNDLKPEKSYNVNLNYIKKIYLNAGGYIGCDASAFYTYFTNRIVPDYEINPNKIIYDNLSGHAVSKGISLNVDMTFLNGLKFILGGTLMGNTLTEGGVTEQQLLTEKFTGTWTASYKIRSLDLSIDYTGNLYSPMRLPLQSSLDPRKPESPWWSIQNIQFTYDGFKRFEIYGGIKNLLNWTPNKGNPFIIARTDDPFDRNVVFDTGGQVVATPGNPYALTFDPSYVYAPNQGIRGFLGIRFVLD